MPFRRPPMLAVAIAAGLLATPAWPQPKDQELLQADRDWAIAAAAGDLDKVFSFWTDDAEIYAPGRPPAIGIEQIRKFVEQRRALPGSTISWEPQVAKVAASGDFGYTRGTYELTIPTPRSSPTNVKGTYVSLWRLDETHQWKCTLEIHSPLPSPAAGE